MSRIKILLIVVFFCLLLVPVFSFNVEEDMVSSIDNRQLTNNPFGDNYVEQEDVRKVEALNAYVQDRIGFRDELINANTIINDKLFKEMVHPSYEYGIDGYVFNKIDGEIQYGQYHEEFAKTIKEIQTYCDDRDVDFVFVFNPAKTTVLQEKLDRGINYNTHWVDQFFAELDELEVNYVNNTDTLMVENKSDEAFFNKQYDAGHWNDRGAFYGINAVIDNLQAQGIPIEKNSIKDFKQTKVLNTSLPVSNFPIHEYEEVFEKTCEISYITDQYVEEIELAPQFQHFSYAINFANVEQGVPKTMVFQGSYINGKGYKFFENCLGEYIAIHDYQNVLNFDYYYNIFQPDCVIFEVAEYVFLDGYFPLEEMTGFQLNPLLGTFDEYVEYNKYIKKDDIKVEKGETLSTVKVSLPYKDKEFVYMKIDNKVFDMRYDTANSLYKVTVENKNLSDNYEIIVVNEELKTVTYWN